MIKKYFQLTSETPNKVFTYAERRPKKKKKKKMKKKKKKRKKNKNLLN